ncbi:MAG: hypothetical protein IK152_07205 [Lachnospiraceae bacterium]|nr:hypothetical protein [Lachnospiraceae bacterium]
MNREYESNDFTEMNDAYLVNADDKVKIKNAFIKSLIGVFPFLGEYLNELIEIGFEQSQNEKQEKLVEIISKNKDIITTDMVKNNEFIINLARTHEMVKRLATNDKIEYYANLIRNGYLCQGECISADTFDEYTSILNEISFREIEYLVEFANRAKRCDNRILRKNEWEEYCIKMKERFPEINP